MLKIHVKKLGTVEVLCLEGQIINGDTEILRTAVELACDSASDIILDLSNVTIVDAHGLGVLLQLREQVVAKGTHFELTRVRQPVYSLFKITRLNTVFEIHSNIKSLTPAPCAQPMPVAA